ncbi:MAG: hypothetical protein JXR36_07325 [Bacteroidales bacterium]|nr:hypothetical protein [Bacteroidales bacterium]
MAYSRQFIVCDYKIENHLLSSFVTFNCGDYYTYIHPTCEFERLSSGNRHIILFGYLLNASNPLMDNNGNLKLIFENNQTIDEIIKATHKMCGRWAIFYQDINGAYLFNDASGLKQVFFSKIEGKKAFSSSENLIADIFNLKISTNVRMNFLKPLGKHIGVWWPGIETPFEEVKALIPDFFINLRTLDTIRFWPEKKVVIPKSSFEIFNKIDTLLKGYYKSLFNNYNAVLGLTGGLDSRVNLAYCKPYLSKVNCSTFYYDSDTNEEDFRIPLKIAEAYSLNYTLFKPVGVPTIEFTELFNKNSSLKNDFFLNYNYVGFCNMTHGSKFIGGVVNEVARSKYWYRPYNYKPKDISNLTFMGENNFSVKAFEIWLKMSKNVKRDFNISIEDLFLIEQKLGRWHGMLRAESDFIHDTFEPFNSREIFYLALCLPKKHRAKGLNELNIFLLNHNWPELFEIPSPSFYKPKKKPLYERMKEIAKVLYYLIK